MDLQIGRYWITGPDGQPLAEGSRPVRTVHAHSGAAELGPYRHYMQKKSSSSRALCRHARRRAGHRARAV